MNLDSTLAVTKTCPKDGVHLYRPDAVVSGAVCTDIRDSSARVVVTSRQRGPRAAMLPREQTELGSGRPLVGHCGAIGGIVKLTSVAHNCGWMANFCHPY